MPHGLPDFGIAEAKETTYNLTDLADLAVRLGSIVEYDRRGDVVYLDDYEAPILRYEEKITPGSTVKLSSLAAQSGAQSARFITPAIAGRWCRTLYSLQPMASGKHGAKVSLNFYKMHITDCYYEMKMFLDDRDATREAGIRINPFAKTLEYFNSGGGWTTFETGVLPYASEVAIFHALKLVVDFTTLKYVRFLFDIWSWDVSDYSFYKVANGEQLLLGVKMTVFDTAGAGLSVLQDNFVYTINEP